MDRPGARQVPEGSGEQRKMEETGCEVICGAPTTPVVTGSIMGWRFPAHSVALVWKCLYSAHLRCFPDEVCVQRLLRSGWKVLILFTYLADLVRSVCPSWCFTLSRMGRLVPPSVADLMKFVFPPIAPPDWKYLSCDIMLMVSCGLNLFF